MGRRGLSRGLGSGLSGCLRRSLNGGLRRGRERGLGGQPLLLEAGFLDAFGCEALFLRLSALGSETDLLGGRTFRCKSRLLGLGPGAFFGDALLFTFRCKASFFFGSLSTFFGDTLLFAFCLLCSFCRESLFFGFGSYRCVTLFLRLDSFGGKSGLFRLSSSPLFSDARLFDPNLFGALCCDFFFFDSLPLFGLPPLFLQTFFFESHLRGRRFDTAALDCNRHEIAKTRDGDMMREQIGEARDLLSDETLRACFDFGQRNAAAAVGVARTAEQATLDGLGREPAAAWLVETHLIRPGRHDVYDILGQCFDAILSGSDQTSRSDVGGFAAGSPRGICAHEKLGCELVAPDRSRVARDTCDTARVAGIEHDDELVGLEAERARKLRKLAIDDDLSVPSQQTLDTTSGVALPPTRAVPGEIDEDASAVGFSLREFSQLGDDVGFGRLLVEKFGDVRGGNAHGGRNLARAVHVARHAEERGHFFVAILRDAYDQRAPKGIGVLGSRLARPEHGAEYEQY